VKFSAAYWRRRCAGKGTSASYALFFSTRGLCICKAENVVLVGSVRQIIVVFSDQDVRDVSQKVIVILGSNEEGRCRGDSVS
jgi:hypothetical protein